MDGNTMTAVPGISTGCNELVGRAYTFTCPYCCEETTLEEVTNGIVEIYPVRTLSRGTDRSGMRNLYVEAYGEPYTQEGDFNVHTVLRCRNCDHEFDGETLDSMEEKGWLKVHNSETENE